MTCTDYQVLFPGSSSTKAGEELGNKGYWLLAWFHFTFSHNSRTCYCKFQVCHPLIQTDQSKLLKPHLSWIIGPMDTDLKFMVTLWHNCMHYAPSKGHILQYVNCIDHAHTVLVSMIPAISCNHYLKDRLIYTQMVTFERIELKSTWGLWIAQLTIQYHTDSMLNFSVHVDSYSVKFQNYPYFVCTMCI